MAENTEDNHLDYVPVVSEPAKKFLETIKNLIAEGEYERIASFFSVNSENNISYKLVKEIAMDLYREVCVPHLTMENHKNKPPLYGCAEELMKIVASCGPADELVLEFLELLEEATTEVLFTSSLRALQVVLLRVGETKPCALEWTFNSITSRVEDLPKPAYLTEGYDDKQQNLLEQDDEILNVLMHYITIGFFFEPILTEVIGKKLNLTNIFRDCSLNQRNVLCCFFMQLIGKPLALLDLSQTNQKTNTYTLQCVTNLTESITRCIGDPYFLLALVEQRIRWKRRLNDAEGVYTYSCKNIFLIEEKLPMVGIAIYYYMLLVENIKTDNLPKIYAPQFIFDSGFYLVTYLLGQKEPALQNRGLLFADTLLDKEPAQISYVILELEVHKNFCDRICNIVSYSPIENHRKKSVSILQKYIMKFDDVGRYIVLQNMMETVRHNGILSHLIIIYKNLVNEALKKDNKVPLTLCGNHFRSIVMKNMFKLPNGIETDLIDNRDTVLASLNALRYFAMCDTKNRTGFWNLINDIETKYLKSLENALDYSTAHYKTELLRTETGLDSVKDNEIKESLNLLDIQVSNMGKEDALNMDIDKKEKIQCLDKCLLTFDMMRSLMGHARDCIDAGKNVTYKVEDNDVMRAIKEDIVT